MHPVSFLIRKLIRGHIVNVLPCLGTSFVYTLSLQDAKGRPSMDRSELLEIASQHLDRVLILLTVAGEDRLAQDIEEIAGCWIFLNCPPTPS
jgi:hypothetical protein